MNETGSFFLTKQKDKPEIGFTTGTCAAAAACAAARMLVSGIAVHYVRIMTPKGIPVLIEVIEPSITDCGSGHISAKCAVRKESGSDPDVTNGVLVYAEVTLTNDCTIDIDGGIGVGRVTLPGLDQKVGCAAINHVPRQMIDECVRKEIGAGHGARVVISIPEGVELASKTFNPRLGITGGISVLGTSGIVEPMSQQALLDTIQVEINMRKAMGYDILPVAIGNYGKDFLMSEYGFSVEKAVTSSNFIYDSIRMAADSGFKRILFIGHIGKLVKVAAGVKNTHSKYGDRRMEILCGIVRKLCCSKKADDVTGQLMSCISTDEAVRILKDADLADKALSEMTSRIHDNMCRWAGTGVQVEVIVFSNVHGILGESYGAKKFLEILS